MSVLPVAFRYRSVYFNAALKTDNGGAPWASPYTSAGGETSKSCDMILTGNLN